MWQRSQSRIVETFLLCWTGLSRSQEDIWSFEWKLWDWSTEEELDWGDHPPSGEVLSPVDPCLATQSSASAHTHCETDVDIMHNHKQCKDIQIEKKKVWNKQSTYQTPWFVWDLKINHVYIIRVTMIKWGKLVFSQSCKKYIKINFPLQSFLVHTHTDTEWNYSVDISVLLQYRPPNYIFW